MIKYLINKSTNYVKLTSSVSIALITLVGGTSAQALEFNFSSSFTPNTLEEEILLEEAMFAIGEVASMWESQLRDHVRVNIEISFGSLPGGTLAGARPDMVQVQYEDVLRAMFLDRTSFDDQTAFENLSIHPDDIAKLQEYEQNGNLDFTQLEFDANSTFALAMNHTKENPYGKGSEQVYLDNNGNQNNQVIWMTTANAKALGLLYEHDTQFDGEIRFSDDFDLWKLTQEEGYDFASVASHEIGHILGFISGADIQSLGEIQDDPKKTKEKDLAQVSTLDLFRYSEESAAMTFSQEVAGDKKNNKGSQTNSIETIGVNDWTIGRVDENGNPVDYYFSLDRGQTKIASFADGVKNQTSHWLDQNNPLGIMTPIIDPGEVLEITDIDLQLFNVIGWNLTGSTNSPVASSFASLVQQQGNSVVNRNHPQNQREYVVDQSLRRGRGATATTSNIDYWTGGYLWIAQNSQNTPTNATIAYSQSAKVPEPNTIFSLLGFSIFGVASFLKKGDKKA